jgi:hypothetical protein
LDMANKAIVQLKEAVEYVKSNKWIMHCWNGFLERDCDKEGGGGWVMRESNISCCGWVDAFWYITIGIADGGNNGV